MQGLLFAIRSGFESRFPLQRELRGQIKIWPLFRLYLLFFSDFSLSSPPNQSGPCLSCAQTVPSFKNRLSFFRRCCVTLPAAQPSPGAPEFPGTGTVTAVPRDEVPPPSRVFPLNSTTATSLRLFRQENTIHAYNIRHRLRNHELGAFDIP